MKYLRFYTAFLLLPFSLLIAQNSPDEYNTPYSAEIEEPMLSEKDTTAQPVLARQDTSFEAVAWVAPFQNGFRALRRDGKMGVLNQDLSVRIPFLYVDVQQVTTGTDEKADYVLIGRRSSHGRYAVLDDTGEPTSEFVLSFNPRLRVYSNCIIDSPHPGQFFIRHRDGRPASKTPYGAVWTHPMMMTNGYPLLTVREAGSWELALFNMNLDEQVTELKYNRISPVEPIIKPRTFVPIMEGYTRFGIELLRPDGKRLSDVLFAGIEDYNNWKELREFFGLLDDPTAEAIAWTKDMDIYIIYDNDDVRLMGRFEGF